MSASREKKQRQNDPNQGLSQKQRQERQEAEAAKRRGVVYAVIGAVVAVLVIALLVWHSGIIQRSRTAVSIAGRTYNVNDVAYYYYTAMSEEYQMTYGTSFDPNADLRTQYVDAEETISYHDQFLDDAVDSLVTVAALENAAAQAGYTLTAEDRSGVEESMEAMKATAQQYGYSNNFSGFLKANFGQYMTLGDYRTCLERAALINGYSMQVRGEQEVTDAEKQSYYEENAENLDSYDFRVVYVDGAAPSGTDSQGNTVEPTEEETAAALQAAKTKADRMEAAVERASDREAEFIRLAPDYVAEDEREDCREDPDYTLSKNRKGSDMPMSRYPYVGWLMAEGHEKGDVHVVEGSSGYYVVLFLDRYRDETPTVDIRHILIRAALDQADDPSTTDVNESTIPSQASLDAARAEAQSLLDQWNAGDKTAESFGALAQEHSADAGSASNGGLYLGVAGGQMFQAFNDWIMDPARQSGETTLIQNPQSGQQGWHVVYFQDYDSPLWEITASDTLTSEKMRTWLDGIREGLEAVRDSGIQYVG